MRPFVYCPSCSSGLGDRDSDGAARCPNCGHSWYENAAPTVGAAIVRDGRALVTKRARAPEAGRYDVPGGFLHPDEHPVAGLKREVAEELGVEVEVTTEDLVVLAPHRYGRDGGWNLALGFVVRLVSGDPAAADDVAEVEWVTRAELDGIDFAWGHDRDTCCAPSNTPKAATEVRLGTLRATDRDIARAIAGTRALIGVAFIVAPGTCARVWAAGDAGVAARTAARSLGGRDLGLALGAWIALERGTGARPWVLAGATADAADALGVLATWGRLTSGRRALLLASAGAAAVVGVRLARSFE